MLENTGVAALDQGSVADLVSQTYRKLVTAEKKLLELAAHSRWFRCRRADGDPADHQVTY